MDNLTELSKKVYQLQIDKGWCKPDEKRDIETLKILILSEAFEAFEAYRKNLYCGLTNTALSIELTYLNHYNEGTIDHNDLAKEKTITLFKQKVKDTFEDEIADVAIRALDLAGYLELDIDKVNYHGILYKVSSNDFSKHIIDLTSKINLFIKTDTSSMMIYTIIDWCKAMAHLFNFDLMQHIGLKLAYNKTRPFRHGNKVV